MTDPVLWSSFVALMCGAVYFAWPRPPAWHPATFHHFALATLLRGEVEAQKGAAEAWNARLVALLPVGPKPPVGGWTEDPEQLGGDYDPVVRLGVGATWDAVADRAIVVGEAVHRRLADVILVWVGESALAIPGVRTHVVASADAEAVLALLDAPSSRVVLATRSHGAAVLAALKGAPALRDRIRAVWFVGANFDVEWNTAQLSLDAFDTEVDRVTPWFVLRLDDAENAALVEPPTPASGRRSFAVYDLGRADPALLAQSSYGEATAMVMAAIG